MHGQLIPYNPLSLYIDEIKKHRPLTREEEHKLAVRYWKYRDKNAAFVLITSNLLFVVKLVMEFRTSHQNILDLIQEGNIGLMEALQRFDPYRNIRFSTYASWWIRAYIMKYLLDNWRMVKIGTTNKKRRLFYKLKKEKARLEAMGITPGPKLLADRLQSDEKAIIEMTQHIEGGDISLDATISEDSDSALIDILPDNAPTAEDQEADREFKQVLDQKIDTFKKGLSKREKIILEERLLSENPATLQEIASRFNKTREAIRYTEKNVIKKLKSFLKKEMPDLQMEFLSSPD